MINNFILTYLWNDNNGAKPHKQEVLRYNGSVQAGIYRFPACPFFIDLVNALKCLILQALRAFLI